jgi:hypothetical protein
MADTDVGKRVTARPGETGETTPVAWIAKYEAGRDGGDHYVVGFHAGGSGGSFSEWMQDAGSGRMEPGQFSLSS